MRHNARCGELGLRLVRAHRPATIGCLMRTRERDAVSCPIYIDPGRTDVLIPDKLDSPQAICAFTHIGGRVRPIGVA